MISDKVRAFLKENHHSVLTTFRANGGAQMSVVLCGLYDNGVAFTTPEGRAKLANLKRNQRCSLLVSQPDWWGYMVMEGRARLLSPENTGGEALRTALREVYVVCSGGEHPNWGEYDQAVSDERRSVVIIEPEKVYGPAI